jgi:hypothetical protein
VCKAARAGLAPEARLSLLFLALAEDMSGVPNPLLLARELKAHLSSEREPYPWWVSGVTLAGTMFEFERAAATQLQPQPPPAPAQARVQPQVLEDSQGYFCYGDGTSQPAV